MTKSPFESRGADWQPSATQKSPRPFRVMSLVDVKLDWIANAVIGAVEGASTDWLRSFVRIEIEAPAESPWYAAPNIYGAGFKIEVAYDDPNSPGGEGQATKILTPVDLQRGLEIMAEKHAAHFADLVSENDDAATHDVLMQLVVLGDVVYG